MPQILVTLLNMFAGPIGNLVDKALLAGAVWLIAHTGLALDPSTLAAEAYAIFSAVFAAITGTQTAKISSVNNTSNGVVVVPTASVKKGNTATVATAPASSTGTVPTTTISVDPHGSGAL